MNACTIPAPPGYTPCIKERGHAGLHDFVRLPDPRYRPAHYPVTDDIVWCSDCHDNHLPGVHRASLTGGSTPESDSTPATNAPSRPDGEGDGR